MKNKCKWVQTGYLSATCEWSFWYWIINRIILSSGATNIIVIRICEVFLRRPRLNRFELLSDSIVYRYTDQNHYYLNHRKVRTTEEIHLFFGKLYDKEYKQIIKENRKEFYFYIEIYEELSRYRKSWWDRKSETIDWFLIIP